METANLMEDLFGDISTDQFVEEKKDEFGKDLYKVSHKEGKDGVYKALIRFVPWWKDSKQSTAHRYTHYIHDDINNKYLIYNSPKTLDKNNDCFVNKVWSKCYNIGKEDASYKKISEKLKRQDERYTIIQIVNDPQKPELNGKLMTFKLPKTIFKMIETKTKGGDDFAESANPYNIIGGIEMLLRVTGNKDDWNDYSQCEWVSGNSNLAIPDEDGNFYDTVNKKPYRRIEATKEDKIAVLKYLEDNSPNLDKWRYNETDASVVQEIKEYIARIVPDPQIYRDIIGDAVGKPTVTKSEITANEVDNDDDDFDIDSELDSLNNEVSPKETTHKSSDEDLFGDDDDMYNDL